MRRKTRKVVLWILGILTAFAFLPLLALFFQDEIIQIFVNQLSEQFDRKISARKVSINFYKNFPNISIHLIDVTIISNPNWPKDRLASIENLYCSFDFYDIFHKKYVIKQLYAENGKLNFIEYAEGNTNYHLFDKGKKENSQPIQFDLSRIRLKNIHFQYEKRISKEKYALLAKNLAARLRYGKDIFIQLKGDIFTLHIGKSQKSILSNKTIELNSEILMKPSEQHYSLKKTEIVLEGSSIFGLQGEIKTDPQIDLALNFFGKKVSLATLATLVPQLANSTFADYQTQGEVYFNGKIYGKWTEQQMPAIQITFGCQKAAFYHATMKTRLQDITFDAEFSNGEAHAPFSSHLFIKNLSGKMDNSPFQGTIYVENFENPFLDLVFQAKLNAEQIINFYPIESVETLKGNIDANIQFKGNIAGLAQRTSVPNFNSASRVALEDISLKLQHMPEPLAIRRAVALLQANALKLDSTHISLAESDVKINLVWKNFIAWLFKENALAEIDASVQSNVCNLDNWKWKSSNADTSQIHFGLQNSTLKLDIAKLIAGKHTLQNVSGRLEIISPTQYHLQPIRMNAVGGSLEATATLKISPQSYNIIGEYNLSNIDIHELFLLFNNFSQQEITADNLDGKLDGKISADIWLSPDGKPDFTQTRLIADIAIREGKLIQFKPLRSLGKFLKNRDYDLVRFAKLENVFTIENQKIYIPRMFINSSIGRIYVAGTQSFSGQMEYRLQIPLNTFKRNQEELMKQAIMEKPEGTALFLKISGNTDDLQVTYDLEAIKDKWVLFLERQRENFLNIFRSKK
ncbi:MAG: hypothetical protein NZM38_09900 [Cytophagales bacterium]|nr:hypothetical protein [Cytophagales bacterium]MDW8385068.1 AsmA-like C-terminal region-containing protein [Flammeovirgaceae bacterium]